MKPLGDGFIQLVRMLTAPITFCTIVHAVASSDDRRRMGRIGLKAITYFEVTTTVALLLGLAGIHLGAPGVGLNIDVGKLDRAPLLLISATGGVGLPDYFIHVIPPTVVGAFAQGDSLQVLFFSVLFAAAVQTLGRRRRLFMHIIDILSKGLFAANSIVVKAAPIGAFGAMAFAVGNYGLALLLPLARLLILFYITCFAFVFTILGAIAYLSGFNIWKLIRFLRAELLIVLGTSSSESALPPLMAKLELLGCDKSVVEILVPAGYTFNLSGTCIMLIMVALFVGEATNTALNLWQELSLLALLLLTSKGAASITGGALVVLATTLASFGTIPVAGLALIFGVYRFLSEAGSLINVIGNAVATVVVARWERAVDMERLRQHLDRAADIEPDEAKR